MEVHYIPLSVLLTDPLRERVPTTPSPSENGTSRPETTSLVRRAVRKQHLLRDGIKYYQCKGEGPGLGPPLEALSATLAPLRGLPFYTFTPGGDPCVRGLKE